MRQIKEKMTEYLTLHLKRKEGIIITTTVNIVCVTYLSEYNYK